MGDYERGKKLFMKRCAQCHVIDSIACINGPTLSGVIGRKSGTVEGYTHSEASTAKGIIWTRETLLEYLTDPRKCIPGTKMVCTGLKKVEDREDLVTYIEVESKKPPKDAGQKWVKPQGHPLPKS
uniref:Cytochrome c domain-containing protein n=2 Tax=Ascaris TaxID=6251 RepID=A0A0M3I5F0_ASCLU